MTTVEATPTTSDPQIAEACAQIEARFPDFQWAGSYDWHIEDLNGEPHLAFWIETIDNETGEPCTLLTLGRVKPCVDPIEQMQNLVHKHLIHEADEQIEVAGVKVFWPDHDPENDEIFIRRIRL